MRDVEGVELRVESCNGSGSLYRQLRKGSQSFLVPAQWISEGVAALGPDAACFRLTAVAYSLDCDKAKPKKNKPTDGCNDIPLPPSANAGSSVRARVLGTTTTQVLRGDRTLTVRAVLPAGSVPFEGRTRIAAQVGALPVYADVPYGTSHTFDHLPDGVVTRVRVTTPSDQAGAWGVGDIAPFTRLDAATPSAVIDVPVTERLQGADAYEWDDVRGTLRRGPLALGLSEAHTAHTADDVDHVPLHVPGPGQYAVVVQPTGKRSGDFALELRDGSDAVRGGSNRSLAELRSSPTVIFVAPSAGTWIATIRRNDREPVSFAYTLSFRTEP